MPIRVDAWGLWLGPLVLFGWLLGVDPDLLGLSLEAHRLAGIMALVIIWWVTEPIPIPATALLAVVLSVMLGAAMPKGDDSAAKLALMPFADPSAFFLLGGMFIGQAMSRHGLDRRFALGILCTRWAGRSPGSALLAVGAAVTLVSMWISNTAATAMIYPVTLGIIQVLAAGSGAHADSFRRGPYATGLLLMTAYASSVGGVATPIGSGTNVLARGMFERQEYFGHGVAFVPWMMLGIPLMLVVFVGMYLWLRWISPATELDLPRLRAFLHDQQRQLGAWNRGELNTLLVFLAVVTFWVLPGVLTLWGDKPLQVWFKQRFPEDMVALAAPVLLYLLPVNWRQRKFTLEAADFNRIDWGTILLFGAGLSLGSLMSRTGLAQALGEGCLLALGSRDLGTITALAIVGGIVLSEFTSNAAAVAALFPVVFQMCRAAEIDPWSPSMALTFAASFGSALPVSTPPNAIVYGSGLIGVRRMIRAGLVLDIICGVAIWVVMRLATEWHWSPG